MQTARLVDQSSLAVSESASQPVNAEPGNLDPTPDLSLLRQRPSIETAALARVAGRMNAATVSGDEIQSLLAERASLLKKKFDSSLTPAEERRLTYVRWSLDRVEDARSGAHLDLLESRVLEYEHFLEEVRALQRRIDKIGHESAS
jgi:hypothetical protein